MVAITQFLYVAPFIFTVAALLYIGMNGYESKRTMMTGVSLIAVAVISFMLISISVSSLTAGTYVLILVSVSGILITFFGAWKHYEKKANRA